MQLISREDQESRGLSGAVGFIIGLGAIGGILLGIALSQKILDWIWRLTS